MDDQHIWAHRYPTREHLDELLSSNRFFSLSELSKTQNPHTENMLDTLSSRMAQSDDAYHVEQKIKDVTLENVASSARWDATERML